MHSVSSLPWRRANCQVTVASELTLRVRRRRPVCVLPLNALESLSVISSEPVLRVILSAFWGLLQTCADDTLGEGEVATGQIPNVTVAPWEVENYTRPLYNASATVETLHGWVRIAGGNEFDLEDNDYGEDGFGPCFVLYGISLCLTGEFSFVYCCCCYSNLASLSQTWTV